MLLSTADRVRINQKRGLKTLVIAHFGGHGVIDHEGLTQAVLNDPEKPLYPIQEMLRSISKLKGCYLIALLDCSRVDWDPEIMQEVDRVSCSIEDATGPQNLILVYGCEPARQVNANSCLIPSLLRRVESSKLENNAIVLPGLLHNFKSLNNGEAVVTVDIDLHLYGPNPLVPVIEESKEPQGPTEEEETKGEAIVG